MKACDLCLQLIWHMMGDLRIITMQASGMQHLLLCQHELVPELAVRVIRIDEGAELLLSFLELRELQGVSLPLALGLRL